MTDEESDRAVVLDVPVSIGDSSFGVSPDVARLLAVHFAASRARVESIVSAPPLDDDTEDLLGGFLDAMTALSEGFRVAADA